MRIAIRQQLPHFQGGAVTKDHLGLPRITQEHPGAPRLARRSPTSLENKAALTLDLVGGEVGADFCLLDRMSEDLRDAGAWDVKAVVEGRLISSSA